VAGTILAAGRGERLGCRPKAALEIAGVTMLERLARTLRKSGVEPLSVVVGPYAETLLPIAAHAGLHPLMHEQPDATLEDSQRRALEHHLDLHAQADLLLVLGDLPLLDRRAIAPLLQAWHQRPKHVDALMPVVEGVRGHPVLLSSRAVHDLVNASHWTGVRHWLATHAGKAMAIPASGPAYVTDLDTPDDLALLRQRLSPLTVGWPAPWTI